MNKMSKMIFIIFMSTMFLIMFLIMTNYFNVSSMIILLIIHSMLIFTMLSLWSKNYMYSIIMFLTLISGLLIIFLYFTSLVSNMKNNFITKPITMMIMIMNLMLFMIMIMFNKYFHLSFMNSLSMNNNLMMNLNKKMFENMHFIYMYPYSNITLICMMFLLLSMFLIIKTCSIKDAPLRKIN